MNKIEITLNTSKSPFFFIPGLFHLSTENPGPVELDTEKLSSAQKIWIKNAASSGQCILQGELMPSVQATTVTQVQESKPVLNPAIEQFLTSKAEALKVAESLIKLPVPALKKALALETNLQIIKTTLELEEKNKKRSNIVKLLVEKKNNLTESLVKELEGKDVGSSLFENVVNVNKNIISDIEDSEEEIVEIKISGE
jgi:hypothetical protein